MNGDQWHREYSPLWSELEADADRALAEAQSGGQFHRRAAFRAVFASLDGIISSLKASLLADLSLSRHHYSDAEIALLREESYGLNSRCEPTARPRFLALDENIRFTVSMLVRASGVPVELELDSGGWRAFKRALAVRHRVTHPRTGSELLITDDALADVAEAYGWVRSALNRNMARALLAIRADIYEAHDALLSEGVKAMLDSMDPELDVALTIPNGGHAFEDLRAAHFIENRDDGIVLSLRGRDYIRWRRRRAAGEATDPDLNDRGDT
jgi:hypothetical protein